MDIFYLHFFVALNEFVLIYVHMFLLIDFEGHMLHIFFIFILQSCFFLVSSDFSFNLSPVFGYSGAVITMDHVIDSIFSSQSNPILSPPVPPQPAKQMSHQCTSRSPAPSSSCLTPCLTVLQGPHLSALNSIETYNCPWMWMSMYSRPAKCIQALWYLSRAAPTSSSSCLLPLSLLPLFTLSSLPKGHQ